jgi:IS4 transposase
MRFRVGLAVGFGTGYYFGAKAGRERYEQLDRLLHKARRSDAFETATDKARAVVDLGVERAREAVEHARTDDPGDRVIDTAVNGSSQVNPGLPRDQPGANPSPS